MSAELRSKIIEAVGEIGKINISMSAFERDLTVTSEAWLADLSEQIKQGVAGSDARLMQSDISAIIEVLLKSPPSPGINTIVGNALSMMLEMERAGQEKSPTIQRLLGPTLAREATTGRDAVSFAESGHGLYPDCRLPGTGRDTSF